jgi:hypothetical protein
MKTEILLFLCLVFWVFFFFPVFVYLLYYCGIFIFVFILFSFFLSVLSTSPLLSSHPYSHPLHSPSFACAKINYSPSNYSFYHFSSTLSPCLHRLFSFSPAGHHTTPPSYTLTTYWPTYCTNFTQSQPLEVPDTSTLHFNRNVPKHTRAKKPSSPDIASPTHPPHFPPSLLVPP